MAKSIAGGLINSGYPAEKVQVSDPSAEQLEWYNQYPGIETTQNNSDCVSGSDILVLAVKPQMMKVVMEGISDDLNQHRPLLISIAAGIRIKDLIGWAKSDLAVIRVMPNTPALVNSGVSGLYASDLVNEDQKQTATQIMQSVGPAVWVERETDIDTVTGISGSGPAYFFRLMEIMQAVAIKQGLPADSAKTLVLQTALGAAKLANGSEVDPKELRRRVTSPNGTTEAGINAMEDNGLETAVEAGIRAAIARSEELAIMLGES